MLFICGKSFQYWEGNEKGALGARVTPSCFLLTGDKRQEPAGLQGLVFTVLTVGLNVEKKAFCPGTLVWKSFMN